FAKVACECTQISLVDNSIEIIIADVTLNPDESDKGFIGIGYYCDLFNLVWIFESVAAAIRTDCPDAEIRSERQVLFIVKCKYSYLIMSFVICLQKQQICIVIFLLE